MKPWGRKEKKGSYRGRVESRREEPQQTNLQRKGEDKAHKDHPSNNKGSGSLDDLDRRAGVKKK